MWLTENSWRRRGRERERERSLGSWKLERRDAIIAEAGELGTDHPISIHGSVMLM